MAERLSGQEYHQIELFAPGEVATHPNLDRIKFSRGYAVFSYKVEYIGKYPSETLANPVIHANYDHKLSIDEQIAAVEENYALYEGWSEKVTADPNVLWDALKEPFS